MLTKSSVEIGVNLSEVLVGNNVTVSAVPGSLLGELSRSVRDKVNVIFGSSDYIFANKETVANAISSAAEGETVGEGKGRNYVASEHDSYMDNYLDELGVLLGNHLNFARNTVNKEINKLVDAVSSAVANYRHREAEDFFNVTYYSLPGIYSTPTIVEQITGYGNSQHLIKGGREAFDCSCVTEVEDLTELLKSGSDEEDLVLRGFLSERKAFAIRSLSNNVDEYRLSNSELLDYHLINYLLARNILNGMDFNTTEPMGSLKRKALINRDYHGASLANALTLHNTRIRVGQLLVNPIESFSYFNDKTIDLVIYEENFAKLAENGLGIEAIFGYIASTNSNSANVKVSDIVSEGKTYVDRWARTRSLYLIHLNSKRIEIFKHLLTVAFDASIHSEEHLTEAEKEFTSKDSGFIETTRKLVYDYIDNLTIDDIQDVDEVCRVIVAKHRFRFSNAFDLLNRMAELLKSDQELDPMTAGLFSACDYMVDYCLAQTQSVKI